MKHDTSSTSRGPDDTSERHSHHGTAAPPRPSQAGDPGSALGLALGEIAEAARFPAENPHPVIRVSSDGRVVYANRASSPLMDAWGVADDGCVPPAWRERVTEVLAASAARKWDAECGGRTLQLNCVPIVSGGYVNIYAADVTERVALLAELAAERRRMAALAEELRQERDLQQALMERTHASLVYLDRDFNFVRMNAAYELACQRPRAEMLGRNHFELFPDAENEAIFRQARDTGEPVTFVARPFEFADQPWRGVTYWDWTLTPVKTAGGEVEGLVFSLVDVTERIRTQMLSDVLNEIYTAITSQTDFGEILRTVMQLSAAAVGCETAAIGMRENDCWVLRYGVGVAAGLVGLSFTDEQALVSAKVAATRRPVGVLADDLATSVDLQVMSRYRVWAVLALPLIVRDAVIGVLTFNFDRPRMAFSDAEMDFAAKLGTAVSLALENARGRDELEQRVRERTAELEAIFASVPDALYVADAGGIVRCNEAALSAFGFNSVEELREQLPDLAERMRSRYADTGEPILPAEFGLGMALQGERAVVETISRHPLTQKDQVHRVAVGPIVLNGQIVAAVALATDITEQKRLQTKLAYQANLLENVNDAILAYDAQMRVTAWNRRAEELYGWTAEEAIGAKVPELVGSRMTDEERSAAMRGLNETGRWQGEMRHTRRDGTPLTIESTSMAICDDGGQVYACVTVNRDITERKAAEAEKARLVDELRESREQLRALSRRLVTMQEAERSYVADQLYNQAGQVLAALQFQLLRLHPQGGNAAEAGQLATLRRTLNEAIHELHDLASQLRPAGLDRSTLARVLETYVSQFGRTHGLAVRFEADGTEALQTPADVGTALFRSVQEGLSNVTRHAQATEIALSLHVDGDLLTVTLADNGVGFEPGNGAAISGLRLMSGLGLASVRERLETVGGRLHVESGRSGTTLTMQAPLSNEQRCA